VIGAVVIWCIGLLADQNTRLHGARNVSKSVQSDS
jgi:hypothetical protein